MIPADTEARVAKLQRLDALKAILAMWEELPPYKWDHKYINGLRKRIYGTRNQLTAMGIDLMGEPITLAEFLDQIQ